jgi:hypothetical protein
MIVDKTVSPASDKSTHQRREITGADLFAPPHTCGLNSEQVQSFS